MVYILSASYEMSQPPEEVSDLAYSRRTHERVSIRENANCEG
jgi:hypothetical protein